MRGASTITQQLSQELLSRLADRLEAARAIIARRLEAGLPKARISDLPNVIGGDGIWGPKRWSRRRRWRAIINPRLLNPARPTAGLIGRQRIIPGRMGQVILPTPVPSSSRPRS
jgi:hypothetical protein